MPLPSRAPLRSILVATLALLAAAPASGNEHARPADALASRPTPARGWSARASVRLRTPRRRLRADRARAGGTPTRFAVIGDFGSVGAPARDVATLVESWSPEFVLTVGDNNYPDGAAETIDDNIGQYYHSFIHPYVGKYGPGASENHFFPTLGNHDLRTAAGAPYRAYFTLPGNERYYDVRRGPVHVFAVNSDPSEPDGVSPDSRQGAWLKSTLAASTAPWKIVYFHHPPYSSGVHGSAEHMRWPFAGWGADAVLSGHDHHYERVEHDGIPYFVNGVGGKDLRPTVPGKPGSVVRYHEDFGAMRVDADAQSLRFQMVARSGEVIDTRTVEKRVAARERLASQRAPDLR